MRIIRMMAVHNEADVLGFNLEWYERAGFPTVALVDLHSEDASLEICERALADGRLLALDTIETDGFEWDKVLARLLGLALEADPEYLLLTAPDEFFEVADGSPLRPALEEDFRAGYNLIKFFNMEFALTKEDDPDDPNPLTRMRHYSLWDLVNYRAYPWVEGLDLDRHLGHRPMFPAGVEDRPSPRRYIDRHYPLRTVDQARRKIRRTRPLERLPRANTHYLRLSGERDDLFTNTEELNFYAEDHRWSYDEKFLPERLKQTARALARAEIDGRRAFEELEALRSENRELREELARLRSAREGAGADR